MATRPRDIALIYAERRLSAWSGWARESREQLGLPPISLIYKAMRRKAERIRTQQIAHGALVERALTASGHETRSCIPPTIGDVPEAIAEVDAVVAELRPPLNRVITADYFTYGPIEVRCKETPWGRARYLQLLESAKYCVFVALNARSPADLSDVGY